MEDNIHSFFWALGVTVGGVLVPIVAILWVGWITTTVNDIDKRTTKIEAAVAPDDEGEESP